MSAELFTGPTVSVTPSSVTPSSVAEAARALTNQEAYARLRRFFHELHGPWVGHGTNPDDCGMCKAAAEAVTEPLNDIEATGSCCCNGCIGEGTCDLEPTDPDNWNWREVDTDELDH
jgi:hypothetical protein